MLHKVAKSVLVKTLIDELECSIVDTITIDSIAHDNLVWKIEGTLYLNKDFVNTIGIGCFQYCNPFNIGIEWEDGTTSFIPKAFGRSFDKHKSVLYFSGTEILGEGMVHTELESEAQAAEQIPVSALVDEKEIEEGVVEEEVNSWGLCDMFGTKFEIGDYITYPTRNGSWMTMRVAKIKDIIGYRLQIKVLVSNKISNITIDMLDRVIIIPKAYVQNSQIFKRLINC